MSLYEFILQLVVIIAWSVFIGGVVAVSVLDVFIRIKSVSSPKYKALLEETHTYEKDLRKMRYDYYHDVKLLKDIHTEKLARIVRGEIEDENEKEKSLISNN